MLIHEAARHTGVVAKTIRYYESIGLLPPPARDGNNYRHYGPSDLERLRFIRGARSIGFSLADLTAILAARAAGEAPCGHVLTTLAQHVGEIEQRIADLRALQATLSQLMNRGLELPQDDVAGLHCICALVKGYQPVAVALDDGGEATHG